METLTLFGLIGMGGIITLLLLYLRHLHVDLEMLLHDPSYGISTRQGLDRRWRKVGARNHQEYDVVFFDIDDMHKVNGQIGYEEVNRRLREALKIRASDRFFDIGRWFSGDEIGCIVPRGDGEGMAQRLRSQLSAQGFSATFGIAPAQPDLNAAMTEASAIVQSAKAEGRRGSITSTLCVN